MKKEIDGVLNNIKESSKKTKILEKKIEQTAIKVAPPIMLLRSKKIEKNNGNISAILRFKSIKSTGLTISFTPISFEARIIEGNSKIASFDLDAGSEIPQTNMGVAKPYPTIASDGKSASTEFYTYSPTTADLRLDMSAPAKVQISGKYLKSPVIIDVR